MYKNSKSEIRNSKQILISQIPNPKPASYDLEKRTFNFAKQVIGYVYRLPKNMANYEIGKQLIRSAGSVGANYIEANESLGKKDFRMRIKISKKEAKETRYWLALTLPIKEEEAEKEALIQESTELMKIFGSIAEKSQ
ncbi:MAG: four helix bundle protein [Patescibacteria group bacterium]